MCFIMALTLWMPKSMSIATGAVQTSCQANQQCCVVQHTCEVLQDTLHVLITCSSIESSGLTSCLELSYREYTEKRLTSWIIHPELNAIPFLSFPEAPT